jgi:hypothetical protein
VKATGARSLARGIDLVAGPKLDEDDIRVI